MDEAALLGHLADGHLGLAQQQVASMAQTAVADEVGDAAEVARLRKGRADALLRDVEPADGGLAVEGRVKVQLLTQDDGLHVAEECFRSPILWSYRLFFRF